MKKLSVAVLLFTSFQTIAQTLRVPVSSSYTRITTYSNVFNDAFSFAANQGALAGVSQFTGGFFGEKRFLLAELSSYTAAFAVPTSSGNVGFKADYFGSAAYNEAAVSLAYARKLGQKLDVGVQFNYNHFKVSSYGSASAINFDAGMIVHLTERLHTGIHTYNPTGVKMGKQNEEKLPAIYSAGIGYDASERFFVGAEIEKVEDQPVNVHAGMQYIFDEKLLARIGVSTATSSYYLGVGFRLSDFRIDATASVHPSLGVTPGLLLIYSAKK